MATFTEHYNLTLPEAADFYDVDVFNENFETLDEAVGLIETEAADINQKIGQPEDGETIFQLLQQRSGTRVYVPTETVRKTTGGVSSEATSNRFKATCFTAAHNGTICILVHYSYTGGSGTPSLYIYDSFAKEYMEMEDCTNTKEISYSKDSIIHSFTLGEKTGPLRVQFPVSQGKCYYIELFHNATSGFVLENCQICFDTIDAAEISEFA